MVDYLVEFTNNEEAVTALVCARADGRYAVSLRDDDADLILDTIILPTLEAAIEMARELA